MKNKNLYSILMIAGLLLSTTLINNLSAQVAKVKTEMATTKKYTCPHHPDQVSDKPGKCGVCGMDLVEVKEMGTEHMSKSSAVKAKTEMATTKKYVCPHHPDKVSDKPGKCECGMDLVELKDMGKRMDMDKMKKDASDMKMDMKKEMKDMKMDSSKMMKKKM